MYGEWKDKEEMKRIAIETLEEIIEGIKEENMTKMYSHMYEQATDEDDTYMDVIYFQDKKTGREFDLTDLNRMLFSIDDEYKFY